MQQQAVLTAGFQSAAAGANAGMPVMPSPANGNGNGRIKQVLPAYIIPTTSKHRREISSGEKRDVGKTVGAVSAECLSEVCCVFYSRLTDGMMCPACGEFLNNGCGTA